MDAEEYYQQLDRKMKIISSQKFNDCHPAGNANLLRDFRNSDFIDVDIKFNVFKKEKNVY